MSEGSRKDKSVDSHAIVSRRRFLGAGAAAGVSAVAAVSGRIKKTL